MSSKRKSAKPARPTEPSAQPHANRWIPVVVYALVTVVLFRKFIFSADMLFGSDTLGLGYVARKFFADSLRAGTFPLWNPYILGGTPFLDSLAGGDSLYPTSLLLLFMAPHRALGWKLVLHVFLAGVLMYGWVRTLGAGRWGAFVSGLTYLMAPFMVSLVYPGHDGKIFVTALTPLAFWASERLLRGGSARWFATLAVTVGLVLLTTHFQMAYFLFGALGIYAIVRSLALGRSPGSTGIVAGRRFAHFLGAAALGVALSSVQTVPAVRYVTEFSRRTATTTDAASPEAGRTYASSYSLHPEEAMGFLVPEFTGNGVGDGAGWASGTYWGRNPIKLGHQYFGIVVLLLAGLGLLTRSRDSRHWTLLGLGAVALLYALGRHTPVWGLFYDLVPGVSLFRAPDMVAYLTGFAAISLAGLGVDALLAADEVRWSAARRWMWGLASVLGLLTVLVATGALQAFWASVVFPEGGERVTAGLAQLRPYLLRGFVTSTLLVAGAGLLITLFREGRVPAAAVITGLAVLAGLDAFRADDTFITTFDVRSWEAPDATMRFVQNDAGQSPSRLFTLMGGQPGQDVKPALYGIELAGGHHPNDLARYRELIGMQGGELPRNLLVSSQIPRLLGVDYLLWPEAQAGPLAAGAPALAQSADPEPAATLRLQDGRNYAAAYRFDGLDRARLVGDVVVQPDDQAVAYMMSPAFDPESQVVLPQPLDSPLPGGPVSGAVIWEERGVNRMRLAVTSDREALLVVADNWYPAWSARVNGETTTVLRAYHTLRAVRVPAGQSSVELFYDTMGLRGPLWLSLAALLTVVALGVSSLRRPLGRGEPGLVSP